ncbi:hypothetical protein [Pseudonocardia sp. H11422]|uniref:hypothetical protein n=1 Tax=Pseudonocardia sp. H11422 TaxID=2835866 RepID=UPI001BDC42B5|nr:hypothetical protein [Pseudonocardia sp. H11422]
MNRIALHQSTVRPLTPVELVDVASRAGIDSIGLRVGGVGPEVDEVQQWWAKGVGSPMLRELVTALLESRVTVLDVGRVQLGPELRVVDFAHPYARVLEVGTRLGAQFVTARAATDAADDPAELFATLAELAARYRLRPLLSVVAGTPVDTLERACAVVAGTPGGVVLDISPHRHASTDVEETVVELADRLGYVRVAARELEEPAVGVPGLLATLPPQVAVVIGDPDGGGAIEGDHVARVSALRAAVDGMLRHPRAAGHP